MSNMYDKIVHLDGDVVDNFDELPEEIQDYINEGGLYQLGTYYSNSVDFPKWFYFQENE